MLLFSLLSFASAETTMTVVGDAYAKYDANQPDAGNDTNPYHPFDYKNGFSVSWFGTDLSLDYDRFGAEFDLRFGPTAMLYSGLDAEMDGMGMMTNVKQGYLTYTPSDNLQIDLGKFDTLYGAEVADAHYNMNYTRGSLNWMAQPFTHTGLRASTEVGGVGLTGIVVNGWNNAFDNNTMKSFGLQASAGPLVIGYIGGPEQDGNNEDWRHFVDAVVAFDADKFHLLMNGDYGVETVGSEDLTWYGASVAVGYDVSDILAVNLRGEYIGDPDGWATGVKDNSVTTGTLTFLHAPAENAHLYTDFRFDQTAVAAYPSKDGGLETTSLSAVVGITISQSVLD